MNIPQELLLEAKKASGAKTQTSAVLLGLRELIRRKRLEDLISVFGTGVIDLTQKDLKRMRRR
jgi:hypothetical protein